MLRRPPRSHPHAHGGGGYWVVQRKPEPPLGWVINVDAGGVWELAAYAYWRDKGGKRPWLKTFASLNSAVAWMLQHERDIRDLIDRNAPEPQTPS